jgi:hypothetical protein
MPRNSKLINSVWIAILLPYPKIFPLRPRAPPTAKSHFGQLRYNRSELTSLPCPCGVPAASIAIALDMEVREPCGAYFQINCGGFFNDRKSDYARWEIKKFG